MFLYIRLVVGGMGPVNKLTAHRLSIHSLPQPQYGHSHSRVIISIIFPYSEGEGVHITFLANPTLISFLLLCSLLQYGHSQGLVIIYVIFPH